VTTRVLFASALLLVVCSSGGTAAPPPDPQVVDVIARRFEFEPSTITVTVGQPVRLMVHSADGVHGIEIKKF
jgi:heme/copper-type cytochrome/quinol oxidase subunit 2